MIKLNRTASFYNKCWVAEHKEISLLMLVESMAHIMSIQLNYQSNNYLANVESNPTYNLPYKTFLKGIDESNLDERWKHLLFLYICYVSCQAVSKLENDDETLPVLVFFQLMARADAYLNALTQLVERYKCYSNEELIELLHFGLRKEDFEQATADQILTRRQFPSLTAQVSRGFQPDLFDVFCHQVNSVSIWLF